MYFFTSQHLVIMVSAVDCFGFSLNLNKYAKQIICGPRKYLGPTAGFHYCCMTEDSFKLTNFHHGIMEQNVKVKYGPFSAFSAFTKIARIV